MILPDVLTPGLRIVFCGSGAGAASAARGAYYAGPGNKFWPTLHAIGLTPRRLAPDEFASVLEYGIGLTDLAKERSGPDTQVRGGYDVERLRAVIEAYAPTAVAFNGVAPGRAALGGFDGYGAAGAFAHAEAWILPSTSGAASGNWSITPWHNLAARLGTSELRR